MSHRRQMSKPQCHVTESCIMLLLMLTTSPGLSYGASLLHPGEGLESALCHAQCLALCREMTNVSQCDCEVSDSIVKDASNNTLWLSECAGQQRYACQGTCSSFQNQSGAAPARAEVRLYNDAQNRQLILKWTPPSPSDTWVMIYIAAVVQAGQIWTPVAEVSDETEVKLYNRHGPCYSPDIRVAAVSSAGMSGFSASVRIKVSQPGQPRNIEVTRLDYRSSSSYDSETVHYTLQWRPDRGWSVQDVQYQVTVEAECPDGLLDQVYVINDNTQHDEESFFLNGQIPTYAFGCKFKFKIILTRACDQKVHRDITEYNFTLNCKDVENYTGDNCNERPVVDPGPVREVKVTEVQLSSGDVLVMVSWLPPENLGSAGYVSSYHVVWGSVNTSPVPSLTDFLFQMDFVKVLGNLTLPGTELGTDIYGNTSDLVPGTDIGVLVRAVGPGQLLQDLMGSIYRDTTGPTAVGGEADDTGIVLVEDGVILAVQYNRLKALYSTTPSWGDETHVTTSHVLAPIDDGGALSVNEDGDAIVSGNSTRSPSLMTTSPSWCDDNTTATENGTQAQTTGSVSPGPLETSPSNVTAPPETRGSMVDVLVYWRRYRLGVRAQTQGYRIRWGVVAESGCHGNITFDSFCDGMTFRARSKEEYLPLFNLSSNQTFGIKVKPIENMAANEPDDTDWSNVTVYTFTTQPYPARPEVTTEPVTLTAPDSTAVSSSERVTSSLTFALENEVTANQLPRSDQDNDHKDLTITTIAASTTAAALLLCCLLGAFWYKRKQTRRPLLSFIGAPDDRNYSLYVPGKSLNSTRNSQAVSDEWELPMSCVKFGPALGSGAFGKVLKGRISRAMLTHRGVASLLADYGACLQDGDPVHATVAIKMLQGDCEGVYRQDFLKEIQLMKRIGYHENIVCMLGCCSLRDPICLVVEHVGKGDLLNYLKAVRHKLQSLPEDKRHYVNSVVEVIDPVDLLRFAGHITRGMEFLASKGFVHRDLAARNVLVGNNRVCKIGDFGLARYVYDNAVYVNRRGGRLPVKWMSVEAIFDMTFSTASDVWSFGVVLFEIVSMGGSPYPTIPTRDLLKELQRGYRMEKPENCSQEVYSIMRQCWSAEPSSRPSFTSLSQWLEGLVVEGSAKGHIDLTKHLGHNLYSVDDDDESREQGLNLLPSPSETFKTATTHTDSGRQNTDLCDRHAETSNSYTVTLSDDSGYVGQQKMSVSSSESNLMAAQMDSDSGSPTSLTMSNVTTGSSPSLSASYAESGLDDVFFDDTPQIKESGNCSSHPPLTDPVKESQRTSFRSGFVRRHSSSSSAKSVSFTGSASSLITKQRRHSETDLASDDTGGKFSLHASGSVKRSALKGGTNLTFDLSVRSKRGDSRLRSVDNRLYSFWDSLNMKTPPSCRPIRRLNMGRSTLLQSVVEGDLLKHCEVSPLPLIAEPLSGDSFTEERSEDGGQLMPEKKDPGPRRLRLDELEIQPRPEGASFKLTGRPVTGQSDCKDVETGSWVVCPWDGEGEISAPSAIERSPSLECWRSLGGHSPVDRRSLSGHSPVDRRSSDSKLTLSPYGSSCSSAPLVGPGDSSLHRKGKVLTSPGLSRFWWPTPRKRRMGTADDLDLDTHRDPRSYPNEKHPSALYVVGHTRGPARRTVSSLDY